MYTFRAAVDDISITRILDETPANIPIVRVRVEDTIDVVFMRADACPCSYGIPTPNWSESRHASQYFVYKDGTLGSSEERAATGSCWRRIRHAAGGGAALDAVVTFLRAVADAKARTRSVVVDHYTAWREG